MKDEPAWEVKIRLAVGEIISGMVQDPDHDHETISSFEMQDIVTAIQKVDLEAKQELKNINQTLKTRFGHAFAQRNQEQANSLPNLVQKLLAVDIYDGKEASALMRAINSILDVATDPAELLQKFDLQEAVMRFYREVAIQRMPL